MPRRPTRKSNTGRPAATAAPPIAAAARPVAAAAPPAGPLLSWAEVQRTHRIRNGVYQKNGRLISLLTDFGRLNPCYPDRHAAATDHAADHAANNAVDPDTIIYTGAGRRGDQLLCPANRALLAAIETGHAVPLFNKLSPGCWQPMGYWRVTAARHEYDAAAQRMLWRFTLKKSRAAGELPAS